MKDTNSVFDNIVKNENSFTELFYNYLKYGVFRTLFLDLIEFNFDKENTKYSDFDTQYSISKFGRPDLAILNDELEVLFEIKVYNTSLTANQPTSYYKHLKSTSKKKYKGLILIAPDNCYDIERYKTELLKINEKETQIFTQVIYWNDIVRQIEKKDIPQISPLFKEYSSFLTTWFQMKSTFLDSLNATTMFGKEFPDSLYKTLVIVDNVFRELKKQKFKVWRTNDKYFEEYGFAFQLPNDEILFFGMWFDYWHDHGNPICIGLDCDLKEHLEIIENELRHKNLSPLTEYKKWHVSFIDKTTLMDTQSEKVISKLLSDIATKLNAEKVLEIIEVESEE
ncbi:MAG TPA: hypothetical protein PK275_12060 [Chitinophagaceae bacterium]|nr:hypothetical protein [Chitinophagaceae bacterium]